MSNTYADLCKLQREVATLGSVVALLNWDQETYMPHGGAAARAEQQELLSTIAHQRKTDARIGDLIAACESNGVMKSDSAVGASVREMRRDYDLATKLPTALVAELAKTTSLAQEAWKEARAKDDFQSFAPWLEKVLDLTRQKAQCYGFPASGELYDALLEEYEPGATAQQIEAIFTPLQGRLSRFVAELTESKQQPADVLKGIDIPEARQHAFALDVLKAIGFDLSAGRLDTTTHPFCSGFAAGDTRLTTRYNTSSCVEPLSSTMHEAGHGMYEQGLPKAAHFGEPLSEATSLGIHESQSRMWENFVGRGRPFWQWALPVLKQHFGQPVAHVTPDQIVGVVNKVERSFIRVEADEATYNLHVMLRFGLERDLISGSVKVADLPGEWNRRFKDLLGLEVPNNKVGCMQDVHWSFGLVGYFPTYTLGNLYAGQLWETIRGAIPDLDAQMAGGEFGALKKWLNENIHVHGRRYRAGELCERVTGRKLTADPFMRYLEGKLRPLYGI